jgi:hypothetical protein
MRSCIGNLVVAGIATAPFDSLPSPLIRSQFDLRALSLFHPDSIAVAIFGRSFGRLATCGIQLRHGRL